LESSRIQSQSVIDAESRATPVRTTVMDPEARRRAALAETAKNILKDVVHDLKCYAD